MSWTGQRPPRKNLPALHKMAGWGHDAPAEVNLGPILCSGPGTSWVTLHRYRQDTQPVHNLYISLGKGAPPSCPLNHTASVQSKAPRPSSHPSGRQAMRCQDSGNPVLLAPTSLWSLYKCEHLPPPSSPPPRQLVAPDGVTRMQACARWGMCLAGLPAWAGLEVCVGKSKK